jgi:hypothetical protein
MSTLLFRRTVSSTGLLSIALATTSCATMEDWLPVHCSHDIAYNDGLHWNGNGYPRLPEAYAYCPAHSRAEAMQGFREGSAERAQVAASNASARAKIQAEVDADRAQLQAEIDAANEQRTKEDEWRSIHCNIDDARTMGLDHGSRGLAPATDQFTKCLPGPERDNVLRAYRAGFEVGVRSRR